MNFCSASITGCWWTRAVPTAERAVLTWVATETRKRHKKPGPSPGIALCDVDSESVESEYYTRCWMCHGPVFCCVSARQFVLGANNIKRWAGKKKRETACGCFFGGSSVGEGFAPYGSSWLSFRWVDVSRHAVTVSVLAGSGAGYVVEGSTPPYPKTKWWAQNAVIGQREAWTFC